MVTVANRLRQLREEKGWTQAHLAEISGVSRPTIIALEKGNILSVKTETLSKIADALGETITSVFFYR